MNIPSVNTAALSAAPKDGAGLLVMRKALGVMAQDGQNLVTMLMKSAPPVSPPHLGKKIDVMA